MLTSIIYVFLLSHLKFIWSHTFVALEVTDETSLTIAAEVLYALRKTSELVAVHFPAHPPAPRYHTV